MPRARVRPFLSGKRISLRPLTSRDLRGAYLEWLNDPDTTRFLETGRVPVTAKALEQTFARVSADPRIALFAILDRSRRHVGNIKLGPADPIHRHASLGILIGEPQARKQGYGLEAVELVVGYGFTQLNLRKITAGMYADHHASRRLFEKAGFKSEGRLRKHLFRDGTYHDKLLMGLLHEDYLRRDA